MANNRQVWVPYFKPTRRLHDSHYRCNEVGYVQMTYPTIRMEKKVVLGTGVDHISNYNFTHSRKTGINIDVSKDGYIMFCNLESPLWWYVPGFSDAYITDSSEFAISDEDLEKMWEEQNNKKEAR